MLGGTARPLFAANAAEAVTDVSDDDLWKALHEDYMMGRPTNVRALLDAQAAAHAAYRDRAVAEALEHAAQKIEDAVEFRSRPEKYAAARIVRGLIPNGEKR
jgi:hypothetical protein